MNDLVNHRRFIKRMIPYVMGIMYQIIIAVIALLQSGGLAQYKEESVVGGHTYYHTLGCSITASLIMGIVLVCIIELIVGTILAKRREDDLSPLLVPLFIMISTGIVFLNFAAPKGVFKTYALMAAGGAVAYIISRMSFLRLKSKGYIGACAVGMVLAMINCIFGLSHPINGSGAWLIIAGVSFQPGEFYKLYVLFLAAYGFELLQKSKVCRICYVTMCVVMIGVLAVVHDLGNGMILAVLFGVILLSMFKIKITRRRIKYIAVSAMVITLLAAAYMIFMKLNLIEGGLVKYLHHVQRRFSNAFFNVLLDSQDGEYNQRRAVLSMIRAGLAGTGTGEDSSYQLGNYAASSDYAFCTMTATFGIGISAVFLISMLIFVVKSYVSVRNCGNNGVRYLSLNLIPILILVQTGVHVLGNIDLIPFTGVVLPFISTGGSSIIISFGMVGLILGNRLGGKSAYIENSIIKKLSAMRR